MASSRERKHHHHHHHGHHHNHHHRHKKKKRHHHHKKKTKSKERALRSSPELSEAALLQALESMDNELLSVDGDKESGEEEGRETLSSGSDDDDEEERAVPVSAQKIQISITTKELKEEGGRGSARCHQEKGEWQLVTREEGSNCDAIGHSHMSGHHSQSHSRGRSHHRHRRRSRSSEYRNRKRRSRSRDSRSRSRDRRSRSRDRRSRSRDRRRSWSRDRRRSRSRERRKNQSRERRKSQSRDRRKSRSRDRRRSRSKDRRRSWSKDRRRQSRDRRSQSREPSPHSNSTNQQSNSPLVKKMAPLSAPIPTIVGMQTKQQKIASLTEFCRHLSSLEDTEQEKEEEKHSPPETQVRDPFRCTVAVAHSITPHVTPTQLVSTNLEECFPVSSGLDHQKQEPATPTDDGVSAQAKSLSVSELVVKRIRAQQLLQTNPQDIAAQSILTDIQSQMTQWCNSRLRPGQFTGRQEITPLSRDEHNAGIQSWVKRNMFRDLAPVMSGFGMKMLQKQGWKFGQPLGKRGEGHTEPVVFDVKIDRHGLSTTEDKQPPVIPAAALMATSKQTPSCLQGKHPVSALQELCGKKHWPPPVYELVRESGPGHMKTFLYRVTIPAGAFQPACSSGNKKMGKAQAAIACLRALGILNDSSDMHAS